MVAMSLCACRPNRGHPHHHDADQPAEQWQDDAADQQHHKSDRLHAACRRGLGRRSDTEAVASFARDVRGVAKTVEESHDVSLGRIDHVGLRLVNVVFDLGHELALASRWQIGQRGLEAVDVVVYERVGRRMHQLVLLSRRVSTPSRNVRHSSTK